MAFRTNKTPVLQEKSASGSVATFNTALAMPLVNGEFSIEAYQEGSGDPAPDNVRNIVPRREVNISCNGEVKTVNLCEDTYGAVYNSVTGVKDNTHVKVVFDGSNDETWLLSDASNRWVYHIAPTGMKSGTFMNGMCNIFPVATSLVLNTVFFGSNNSRLYVVLSKADYPNINTIEAFKAFLSENNLEIVYPLATPTETQLEPTPINTFNGDNNIFCDTGDIDLTYKDLDIAKRGSFREVFKLPS